jgi:hypothetical protein
MSGKDEDGLRTGASPAEELVAARALSKAGDLPGALARMRALRVRHPERTDVQVSLAWQLIKAIQLGLKEEGAKPEELWGLVHEYGRLERIPRPSEVHSRMLQTAAKIARRGGGVKFCEFLKWWNPEASLREEDFVGVEKTEGGHFNGTVELAIGGVAKTIADCRDEAARREAYEFVEKHAPRYPEQAWFPYYRATCALAVGRREEARALMMATVRGKMAEFWAWEKLGLCYPEGSGERLQCLCRAATCASKGPEFMLGLQFELAKELLAAGRAGEARQMLEQVREIRSRHGWSIRGELARMLKSTEGTKPVDAGPLLRTLAAQANDVLLSEVPWRRGVAFRANVEFKREDGKVLKFHVVTVEPCGEEPGPFECRVSATAAVRLLERLPAGSPVGVRLDASGGRPRILGVRERSDGEPWDVCAKAKGVVERVYAGKGSVAVRLEDGRTGVAYADSCAGADALRAGDTAEFRWTEWKGKLRLLSAKAVP